VQTVIIAVLLLVVISVVYSMLLWRIKQLEAQLKNSAAESERLRNELQAILDGAVGVGQRVQQIESSIKRKEHREYRESGEISVKQAIELARKGANVDELVAICGLSRGEAELLATIHKAN
jgi:biopolymer transport protein ExbB/TolQ